MKNALYLLLLLFSLTSYTQSALNLDFEITDKGQPISWNSFGSKAYNMSVDSTIFHGGKYSASISYDGDTPDFSAWAFSIPANYDGEKIKLSGYIKTENVEEGWAGLWMRIDPGVAFDNMTDRGVTGTTDWQQYEIELELNPEQAQKIVVGGLLGGKGKMWLDDLSVTIDGKPLAEAKPKALLPAELDTAFNSGSNITFPLLNDDLTKDLALLGKIWGFLKYHHPEVGKGNYNWDYELFRMLPDYLKHESSTERDQILVNWIAKYAPIEACTSCAVTPEDAFLQPDLAWITADNISKSLRQKLLGIQQNRHQGTHFYIGMAPYIGNPTFTHEAPYTEMPYPDAGFRLLALYRYWNMIHYYFPYKHLIDKNWNQVLADYIPQFINATDELAYELAAVRIIGDIKDTHANLWGGADAIKEWKGKYYPPVHTRFIEDQLVITDYYNPELSEIVGLEVGDVITKINGEVISNIVSEISKYYPASNAPTRLRDISGDLLRSNNQEIEISYLRDKTEETQTLNLYERDSLNIYHWYRRDDEKCFKLLEDNIGYITLKSINDEDIAPIKEAFRDTKGIIIDIRNYPSTFVPFSLGSYFLSDTTAFVKFTGGNVDNPGEFTFTESIEIPISEPAYKGKLIVIVNELSQSQAEYTTMAFRAGENTTVIGSTTAGADGNVSTIYLPGGLRTMISGIGVYYPDGTETQRIGIVPDVEVHPTIAGIKSGRDELLEKAIELIKE